MNISHSYRAYRGLSYINKKDGLVVIRTRDLRRVKATS